MTNLRSSGRSHVRFVASVDPCVDLDSGKEAWSPLVLTNHGVAIDAKDDNILKNLLDTNEIDDVL